MCGTQEIINPVKKTENSKKYNPFNRNSKLTLISSPYNNTSKIFIEGNFNGAFKH